MSDERTPEQIAKAKEVEAQQQSLRVYWLNQRLNNRSPEFTEAPTLEQLHQSDISDDSYSDEDQQQRVEWVLNHSTERVLDIGCGHGYMLSKWSISSVGIDYDRRRIALAQYRQILRDSEGFEPYRSWQPHTFYCIDALFGLPWHNDRFNTCWLCEVLEHNHLSDAKFLLSEAIRVTSNRVLITLPFMDSVNKPYHLGHLEHGDHKWYPTTDMLERLLWGFGSLQCDMVTVSNGAFLCVDLSTK